MDAASRRPHAQDQAMSKAFCVALLISAGFGGLGGCVSVRTSHGYVLERGESQFRIENGVDTKESVLAKYGEPSTKGAFDEDYWYYMASQDSARAFFKPKTKVRQITAVKFAANGVVEDARVLNVEDGYKVRFVSRETPSRGKELSFWEQLLGNVGQLPTAGQGAPGGPGGPGGPDQ